MLAQLAINHLVAPRSGEVQAVFPFSERSEHAPPVRGTGTPEGDLFDCVRPKEEVDPPVAPTRTTRGPGVLADPGPFPWVLFGASSAREHQHDDEAGGDNCGLQIQRQREVGGGTRETRGRWSCCYPTGGCAAAHHLERDYVSRMQNPQAMFLRRPRRWPTGRLLCTRALTTLGTTASIPSRREHVARSCGPPRGRGFSLSFWWEAMQRLRPIFVIGSPYCPLPEVLCDHRPSA